MGKVTVGRVLKIVALVFVDLDRGNNLGEVDGLDVAQVLGFSYVLRSSWFDDIFSKCVAPERLPLGFLRRGNDPGEGDVRSGAS